MSEWRRPRRVKLRRFDRRPEGCRIVPMRDCKRMIDRERNQCFGYAVPETDDEPHPCCQECRYLAGDLRGDA